MLVLTRKINEGVILTLPDGRKARLLVTSMTHDGKVRLGVEAPRDVPVHREEVYDAIKGERRATK